MSVFKGSKKERLKYYKDFVGRSYKLFRQGTRAAKTLEFYSRQLYYFCEYLDKSTEEITSLTKRKEEKAKLEEVLKEADKLHEDGSTWPVLAKKYGWLDKKTGLPSGRQAQDGSPALERQAGSAVTAEQKPSRKGR